MLPIVKYYGEDSPRHWVYTFLEIKDEIPELFQKAGLAQCVTHATTGEYLVVIDLHQPLHVRYEMVNDGKSKIGVNKDTGAILQFDALVSRWVQDGDTQIRLWISEHITVYKEDHPEGRDVSIEELRQKYRELAHAITTVWEVV